MKPCTDRKEAIALFATGALTASENVALRGHLQECAACSAYASQLGTVCAQLGESLAKAPVLEPPPGFHARLKHRIQSEQETAAPASVFETLRALLTPARCIFATALLALAFGVAFWFFPGRNEALKHGVSKVGSPPVQPRNDTGPDLAKVSTLMAYQAAFNRSYEDLDALVTQNARRNSTADGMTLMGGGTVSF